MGLILLGSRNLASDEADQRPTVIGRKKETTGPQWPYPHIELVELSSGLYKVIFHFYEEWPTDEWNALKESLEYKIFEVDMSSCQMDTIGQDAFSSQRNMQKVSLPPHLKTIEGGAFFYTESLQLDSLPDSVEEIYYNAFTGSGISIKKLPRSLKTIGSGTFRDAAISIDKVPKTVESIGNYAFSGCVGIERVEIAAGFLSENAFNNCANLKKVWIRSSCLNILAHSTSFSPFTLCPADLEIYAEPNARPSTSGNVWDKYYNYTSSNPAVEVTVTYGQTTSPF